MRIVMGRLVRASILPVLLAVLAAAPVRAAQSAPPVNAAEDPLLRGLRWRAIGPVDQGGRVNDIAVAESDVSTFYVGFATGGVWKTVNNGVTFTSVFDTYGTHSIGDLAIAPSNPNVIYVGTGENNNRQSSSFGDGVYRSTDGGRTFVPIGLRETQTISRIVVHPTNPDIVWVAANGHLFGPNSERGVYKTTNGGRNWTRTLFIDDNTGATDIVLDPSNPSLLFAAMYQRRRTAWGFVGGGPGSGIYRSDDGGQTWSRVVGNGLPTGTMGRIGLDISRSNPNVIYAQIEVAPDREPPPAADVLDDTAGGERPPDPAVSGVWRSDDKGRTWQFMSNQNERPMYYSQIRVDPNDENVVYVGGASSHRSTDGGRTWERLTGFGHVDHHAIWIDPNDSRHIIYGNDGSVDVSWDRGQTWQSLRNWAVGQAYHVSVDMRRPYYVCTGLQDNGSWCGPSAVRADAILAEDWYRVGGGDGFYTQIDPTDPTVVYSESQNGNIRRWDLREGTNVSIRPRVGGPRGRSNIVPPPDEATEFRWNWNSPILLSPHDPNTIYLGGNRLFISRNRGETWSITQDLTKQIARETRSIMAFPGSLPACSRARVGACILSRNDGVSDYGTIVTIAESPAVPGILWVGTDDGSIQVSRDGGVTWTEVGGNLPGGPREYQVSRVEASAFEPGTAFVSLDGHRSDDLRPYVFMTEDYGATWTSIASNLPERGNVNTIRQDRRNPDLLYVGTEFGFFVSLDRGLSWKRLMTNLPVVRVDDVLVHPRDNDLVLATHGRSIQIMDDITPLQQMTPDVLAKPAWVVEPRAAVLWKTDVRLSRSTTGAQRWRGEPGPRGTWISYFLQTPAGSPVSITIHSPDGAVFRTLEGTRLAGLNRVHWDLRADPPTTQQAGGPAGRGRLADPGVYRVSVEIDGQVFVRTVTVEADIWM